MMQVQSDNEQQTGSHFYCRQEVKRLRSRTWVLMLSLKGQNTVPDKSHRRSHDFNRGSDKKMIHDLRAFFFLPVVLCTNMWGEASLSGWVKADRCFHKSFDEAHIPSLASECRLFFFFHQGWLSLSRLCTENFCHLRWKEKKHMFPERSSVSSLSLSATEGWSSLWHFSLSVFKLSVFVSQLPTSNTWLTETPREEIKEIKEIIPDQTKLKHDAVSVKQRETGRRVRFYLSFFRSVWPLSSRLGKTFQVNKTSI